MGQVSSASTVVAMMKKRTVRKSKANFLAIDVLWKGYEHENSSGNCKTLAANKL